VSRWKQQIEGDFVGLLKQVFNNEDGCLLGCSAGESRRSLPTFQRSLLSPSSGRWWWRQRGPLKRWLPSTRLHGASNQKTAIFVLTAMRTSNPTWLLIFLLNVSVGGKHKYTIRLFVFQNSVLVAAAPDPLPKHSKWEPFPLETVRYHNHSTSVTFVWSYKISLCTLVSPGRVYV
jgi:hypothetical protein